MKVFLSLIICMGLVEKRDLAKYWSTDFVVDTPFLKNTEYILATPGAKRKRPSRDCVGCNPVKSKWTGWKRKQTSFWCPDCQKPLCIPECFRAYHTVKNYRQILVPGYDNGDSDSD